jgi:hypothetical protein
MNKERIIEKTEGSQELVVETITTMIDVITEGTKNLEKRSQEKIEEDTKRKKSPLTPNVKKSVDRDVLVEKIDILKMRTDHDDS